MTGLKYCLQETSAGYTGYAWTEKGIYAVTLPCSNPAGVWSELEERAGRKMEGAAMLPPAEGEPAYGLGECLRQYFEGGRPDFSRFRVDYTGYTAFQARVLQTVREIPYGDALSYKEVAILAGNPRASRAVGSTMAKNRALYLVPCHRVIKSDGSPGGFGAHPEVKKWLLQLERNDQLTG